MGCFFGCFRVKNSNPDLVTSPEHVDVVPRSKNALSSLFQCDEEDQNPLPGRLDVKELKDEAMFLKACGTLPETPVEIKKALDNWNGKSCSLVGSPSSCITDGKNPRTDIQNVITPIDMLDIEPHSETSAVRCKNGPVCFECESESAAHSSKGSSSDCASQLSKQFGSSGNRSVTKPSSPYSIPLKLTDEMQTPLPAYTNDMAPGNITKVNPVLNQVEGPSELKDEYSESDNRREILKLNDGDNVMSTPMAESTVKEFSVGKDTKIEASLSDWLKPVSSMKGGNNEQVGRISREKVYRGKTPGDRPILGMVAAHWNEDETSRISPKWWDGNGIPNSTNKYKEDQKVSWHATPFEERLEKALSEETFISQRKPVDRMPPFDFDETEESDTAFSHLQSSDHIKSVVSF